MIRLFPDSLIFVSNPDLYKKGYNTDSKNGAAKGRAGGGTE